MAAVLNHTIRNAVLDFQYNGNTDGIALQQEVREWFDEFAISLEQALNGLSVEDKIISINELELEVFLNGTDWKQPASHRILEQLKDRLRLIKTGSVSSEGYIESKIALHFAGSFLHFLEHGYLPWQTTNITPAQWNKKMEQLITNADETFVLQLKNLLAGSSACRERFLQTIPFQTSVELFRLTGGQGPFIYQQFVHDLQLLMKIGTIHQNNNFLQNVYHAFLLTLSDQTGALEIKQQLAQAIEDALENPGIQESVANAEFQSQTFISFQKELITKKQSSPLKTKAREYSRVKQTLEEKGKSQSPEALHPPISEPVFISNAGLVLLAAFLPSFFEKTKLNTGGNPKHALRAVCLANYLVTGQEKMEEFELVLPKIVCGVPVSKPVDTGAFHIKKREKKEVKEMLASVIEHWSILKNTSADGLRESFLKRDGKLSFNGESWLLQVEQKSYDMLLQQLPWNISMIKLPWMNHLLITEWVG